MSKGFRDEAQLWTWMKPRMIGKWTRVECFFPEGFFDVMGSIEGVLIFVERKIADQPDRRLVEPGQIEFAKWMESCGRHCWFAWGGKTTRTVRWTYGLDFTETGHPAFWEPTPRRRRAAPAA